VPPRSPRPRRTLLPARSLTLARLPPYAAAVAESAAAAAQLTAPQLPAPSVLMCGDVPALEVLYAHNPGGEIVGVLTALLDTLQAALCSTSYGYLYACGEYHTVRLRLYATLGASLCGFPAAAWNGTRAPAFHLAPAQALELLLAQCVTTFSGDLAALAQKESEAFMLLSSRARSDVSAVLRANALKAGAQPAAPGAAQDAATYPPLLPALAPVPVRGRAPALRSAQPPADAYEYVPSNPSLFAHGLFAPYEAPRLPSAYFPDLALDPASGVPNPDATSQYPDKFAAAALRAPGGADLYQRLYLAHPAAEAHFLPKQCATAVRLGAGLQARCASALTQPRACYAPSQAWDDAECFPVVLPAVGGARATHDAYGNRLLSDRGQAVPPGTPDAAGTLPPVGTVVPTGAFTAPIPFAAE
jgi:hypothetical protein